MRSTCSLGSGTHSSAPIQIRNELRAGFASGKLTPIAYRKYQLLQLVYMLKDNMARFEAALLSDLNRPVLESRM